MDPISILALVTSAALLADTQKEGQKEGEETRTSKPEHPVRWPLLTHRGEPVDMVRALHIDLVRAYRQKPKYEQDAVDTGYHTLEEFDKLDLFLRSNFGLFHWQQDQEHNNWIWIPSPISPTYRTPIAKWNKLISQWPAFLDEEWISVQPNAIPEVHEGEKRIPGSTRKARFYVATSIATYLSSWPELEDAKMAVRALPKQLRDRVFAIVEVTGDTAVLHEKPPSIGPKPGWLRHFPDDERLLDVLIEEYDRSGLPINTEWAYSKAREMNVPVEAVSKISALLRRLIGYH